MSKDPSMFLDNTKKDLLGDITAVVLVAAFMRSNFTGISLDTDVQRFLSSEIELIRNFTRAALASAAANSMYDHVMSTIADLDPELTGYYNPEAVNSLLSLYNKSTRIERFWDRTDSNTRQRCMQVWEKKLIDLFSTCLWSRVDAYERGEPAGGMQLPAIRATAIALIPADCAEQSPPPGAWLSEVIKSWRDSDAVQKGLELTKSSPSGLTRILSEI